MKVHEPGECFDPLYGEDCNGEATFGVDSYLLELNDDDTPYWLCAGVREGRAQDV